MAVSYRARLAPNGKAEKYVFEHKTFRKSKGWYQIDDPDLAGKLSVIRENVLNPEASPLVFQVLRVEDAKAVEQSENVQVDPRGTVDTPSQLAGAPIKPTFLTEVPKDDLPAKDPTQGDATIDHLLSRDVDDDEVDEDPSDDSGAEPDPKEEPKPEPPPRRVGKVGKKKKVAAKKG
jgi:hypothetical protein